MADVTVNAIKKGWAGDVRRQRVVLTGSNGDTLPASIVGLHKIFAITPTGRSGTVQGVSNVVPALNVGRAESTGAITGYKPNGTAIAALSSDPIEVLIYGI